MFRTRDNSQLVRGQDQELQNVGRFNWRKILKLFIFRVPLWLILLIMFVSGSWFGFRGISKEDPVNLRPAVINATNVEILIKTCNKQLDENNIDIRREERNIKERLQNVEGVKKASVLIERDRKNCKE